MTPFADPDLDQPLRDYERQAEQRENTRPDRDEYDDWADDLGDLADNFTLCVAEIDQQEQTVIARAVGVLR